MRMKLRSRMFWGNYQPSNFGDWIGPYIFKKIRGYRPRHSWTRWYNRREVLFTVGSIVRNIGYPDRAVVWGSGVISAKDSFSRPKRTCAVRGPKTRERFKQLGYQCPEIYGDPAILMPFFYRGTNDISHEVGVVPHYMHYPEAQELFSSYADSVKLIDVTQDVEKVIDDISSCEVLVSSSLHGIVIAHAYGRKAAWVSFPSPLIGDGIKFIDYAGGVGHEYVYPNTVISDDTSIEEIRRLAHAQHIPDLKLAQRNIAEACPFGRVSLSEFL